MNAILPLVTLACAGAIGLAQHAADDPAPAGSPASLESLSWLEGRWHGSHATRSWEEHWSAPKAGSIVGMFRMVDGDTPIVYELLLIEEQEDAIVYHLRHFGTRMDAWEDGPLLLDVVRADDDVILFHNRSDEDGPAWIRYSRRGNNAMSVWIGATPEPGGEGFSLDVTRHGS